jgi:G8 domain
MRSNAGDWARPWHLTHRLRLGRCLLAAVCMLCIDRDARAQHAHDFTGPGGTIPGFADSPTISSARAGSWASASTWSPARLPTASDVVRIAHEVTYDTLAGTADVVGIASGGQLRFATNTATRLRVGILLVMPGGVLEVGTPQTPIAAQVAAEILIANRPLSDTEQWGTGLIAVGGRVTMHGAPKSPTFVRTAAEPLAGQTVIQLSQPVTGWRSGDQVFLPDTRQVGENDKFNSNYALQFDRVVVQNVAADGRSVTVTPLRYDHRGARDADGTPTVLQDGTRLLPHVGNLTRNVIIRSENPSGTRGHTAFTHRTEVSIAYAQFQDLGRTRAATLQPGVNQVGRYPLHIHHLWGPVNPSNTGYQFQLVGNAVNDSLKWPIAVHGSHYGLIRDNVVFGGSQLTGAGIAVEDGSETENRFESNLVAVIRGNVNPRETGSDTQTTGSGAECFWAAGFNNRFINNVASDCRNPFQQIVSGPGFKFFTPSAPYTAQNPRFRGADMLDASETVSVTPQRQPLLEFRGNEVYGGSAAGFTAWHLGTSGYDVPTAAESVIRNFKVWHVYEAAIWNYPVNRVTIEGLVYRVDPDGILYWEAAIQSGDYRDINLTIRGGDIHAGAVFGGTEAPLGTIRIENVRAVTRNHAFFFPTPETPGTGAGIPNPPGITVVLRNNVVLPWPGRSLATIETEFQSGPSTYPNVPYQIFVEDYQGQSGNNFRVYWREQATQSIAGGRAPCNDTTSRPEIAGITCAGGSAPPPPTSVDCVVSPWGAWQSTSGWSACTNGSQSRTEQRTRTIVTPPSGGGAACPALTETRTVTQACTPPPAGVIAVTPSAVSGTITAGTMPPAVRLTVTTPGVGWSTADSSNFYDATPACETGTCASGGATTLTPRSAFFASAVPGTYSSPITIRATGLANVVVPVTIVVQAAPAPPPPAAVNCVVSVWSGWAATSAWSACTNGSQSRTEQRRRTIVTAQSGGGQACPALTETRTVTQACTPPATPVNCVVSAWSAWEPTTAWSACANGIQSRSERRTRTIQTPSRNGGTACPALVDTRTASRSCAPAPPPPPEVCNDGLDNDGDGQVDENCSNAGSRAPSAPRRLWRLVHGNTVYLGWRSPIAGGTPTGYIVQAGLSSGQTAYTLPVGLQTLVRIPNVGPGKYYVRVRAMNRAGLSPPSNEVAVTVGCSTVPSQPHSLTSQTSGNRVSFTWEDDDGCNDTSFRLRVGSVPGVTNLADVPVETTEFTAAAPPGTYYARVVTVSPFGETSPSNEIAVTVDSSSCMVPTFPTGLEIQMTGRQVTASWGPADEAAAMNADDTSPVSYVLEVGTESGSANLGTFAMGRATAFITEAPLGTYFVRVRPGNACGMGPPSNEFVLQVR